MISSLSAHLLAILASSLTCLWSNLVIFIFAISIEFFISLLFLWAQLLQTDLSVVSSKLDYCTIILWHFIIKISTNSNAFEKLIGMYHPNTSKFQDIKSILKKLKLTSNQTTNWLQTLTSHIENTKHKWINNLHIFTIIFLVHHI